MKISKEGFPYTGDAGCKREMQSFPETGRTAGTEGRHRREEPALWKGAVKEMRRRKRQARLWIVWMMVSACAAAAGGCSYSREPAVLGRPEGPAGERGGNPAETDVSGQEDETKKGESFLEMLDIPTQYSVKTEEEGLALTADAAVEIPDV